MARHLAIFYLEGGHEVELEVEKLEVQITEEGNIAGYTVKHVEEERLSYLYFKPASILGIKSILLEAEDEEDDAAESV